MAPSARLILPCFGLAADNVPVPAPAAKENGYENVKPQRRWTGEIKRKILAAATSRRPRIWAVRVEPCDDDNVYAEKQRAQAPPPEPKVPDYQATTRLEGNDGAPETMSVAIAVDTGRRKKKGLRVRFDLPPLEEEMSAVLVQPRFPTGVLGEPPESFARSGAADMTAAFLMSIVIADEKRRGVDSSASTRVERERDLVACWTERKAACSRRLSYLRDYCPFQREEEEEAESELETMTRPEAAESGRVEARPVKTGLPFDSSESEAEFVKAIRSRYLPKKVKEKDDFLFRHGYERSRYRTAEPDGRR